MDKFGTDAIYLSFMRDEQKRKEILDTQAHKNYVYYKGDHLGITAYLLSHLSGIISDPNVIGLMPKVYLNDIPKITKRLCMLYKNTPYREYNKELSEDQQVVLNKANKSYKEFHRQAKLLNTIIVRPIWREKTNSFDYNIFGRQFATAITNEHNQFELEEIYYPRMINIAGKDQTIYFHWTNDEYWATDDNQKRISPAELSDILTPDGSNPYKRIPFAVLRLQESEDFWGDGLSDLVNLVEVNNGRLCDATYKRWLSFGYPVGVNLGITASEFEVAPYKPIMANNVKTDEQTPSLNFITPDHQTAEDQELIDYTRKAGGTSKGLSAGSFEQTEAALSGYAKMIDNLELIDLNNDDRDALMEFEKDLFSLMSLEAEVSKAKVRFNGMTLDKVVFSEYKFPKTTDEIWKDREMKYKFNQETPIDWLVEDEGLDEDEARQRILDNRKLKIEIGDSRPTLFETVNG